MTTCPLHPAVPLLCPACAGTQGGKSTSPKKVKAAKRNGRKGGRPTAITPSDPEKGWRPGEPAARYWGVRPPRYKRKGGRLTTIIANALRARIDGGT